MWVVFGGFNIIVVWVWFVEEYIWVMLEFDWLLVVWYLLVELFEWLVIDIEDLELSVGLCELLGKVKLDDFFIVGVCVG